MHKHIGGLIEVMKTVKNIIRLAFLLWAGFVFAGTGETVRVGSYNIRLSGANGSADKGTPNTWQQRKEDLQYER